MGHLGARGREQGVEVLPEAPLRRRQPRHPRHPSYMWLRTHPRLMADVYYKPVRQCCSIWEARAQEADVPPPRAARRRQLTGVARRVRGGRGVHHRYSRTCRGSAGSGDRFLATPAAFARPSRCRAVVRAAKGPPWVVKIENNGTQRGGSRPRAARERVGKDVPSETTACRTYQKSVISGHKEESDERTMS